MVKVKVKLRKSTVEGKAGVIYYQLCHKRQSRQITTGIRLFPDQWDARRERVMVSLAGRDAATAVVQRQIDGDLCLLRAIVGDFEARREEYGLSDVVGRFRSSERFTVFAFVEKQIACLRADGKLGTARNYRRTLNSFSGFLNGADIPFSLLDERLVGRYNDWLQRRRIVRNTVSFYMRVLRAVFNKAVREGIVPQSSPFRNVYTGVDHTRKRAVGEETVIRLRCLNLEHSPSLALARDIFIFSYCARGMAFVDIAFLRKQDIAGGTIRYVRRKTGQHLTIRIEPCMGDIIERYSQVTRTSDYVFPLLSAKDPVRVFSQYQTALGYYNRRLKRLADLLELEMPLSSYTSRHTWATTARNHNVSLSVISAGMGHASEKTTQIYLASLESSVIDQANRSIIASLYV
ncbi:phage integrase SAM-like domain-containing protein [Alistipes finegoldii]|uniref:phage integrase SAM-like domain-containing protein n=1 Tax=Alistipes finegoldii TaxID=214856 RepID=UPI003AB31CD9